MYPSYFAGPLAAEFVHVLILQAARARGASLFLAPVARPMAPSTAPPTGATAWMICFFVVHIHGPDAAKRADEAHDFLPGLRTSRPYSPAPVGPSNV